MDTSRQQHFIGGHRVAAATGEPLPAIDPRTGEAIGPFHGA